LNCEKAAYESRCRLGGSVEPSALRLVRMSEVVPGLVGVWVVDDARQVYLTGHHHRIAVDACAALDAGGDAGRISTGRAPKLDPTTVVVVGRRDVAVGYVVRGEVHARLIDRRRAWCGHRRVVERLRERGLAGVVLIASRHVDEVEGVVPTYLRSKGATRR